MCFVLYVRGTLHTVHVISHRMYRTNNSQLPNNADERKIVFVELGRDLQVQTGPGTRMFNLDYWTHSIRVVPARYQFHTVHVYMDSPIYY